MKIKERIKHFLHLVSETRDYVFSLRKEMDLLIEANKNLAIEKAKFDDELWKKMEEINKLTAKLDELNKQVNNELKV